MAVLSPPIPIATSRLRRPSAAADLAARIPIPVTLPPHYDGEPLAHLSNSSYTLFLACPEAWRRRYMLGEKMPRTGAMFLGSRVDDIVSLYYQRILEANEQLDLAQLYDAYRDLWRVELAAERNQLGVDWQHASNQIMFEMGLGP